MAFTPFLKYVAEDLLRKYDHDLKNLTIVLPSKRGGLFFNRYLSELSDHPLWSPSYMTMDDLFHSLSDLDVADQPLLIFHLYAAYAEAMQAVSPEQAASMESLDQFYSWGEVMLSDFDDIDNNLAHADKIFTNMKDLDDLTSLDYLSEEQREAIAHYFGIFEVESDTALKKRFLSIWNLLYPTYEKFRDRLLSRRLAYEGMLRREVAEQGMAISRMKPGTYVFVGFNVLNKTEQLLLEALQQEGRALFYWDYDHAYLEQGADNGHYFEAGRYIRENLRRFGSETDNNSPCHDNMRGEKTVRFVASPSNSGETRYAGEWVGQHIRADRSQHETAVVLCDERMLQSLLHSMPELDTEGQAYQMNVTMGFPLIQTPAAGLVMTLLELHVYGARNKRWYYTYVSNVLKHPYTVRMTGGESARILQELKDSHQYFVDPSQFDSVPFLQLLFERHESIDRLLSMLAAAIQEIALSYAEADSRSFDIQLYQESLYATYTLLNRLRSIREQVRQDTGFQLFSHGNDLSDDRYLRLIRQMLQSGTVPFHGEPAEGIQVIGLLETRCLDFEHVVIAGMNDENIPKSVRRTSFIPYSLREAHGMTTLEARASLYAYSFYHLLQRASDITLIYNSTVDELSKGEMSRFMTQLLVEQDEVFSGKTKIEQTALEAKVHTSSSRALSVHKTDSLMQRLTKRFTGHFLSPSAINTYIDCPFKFYLQKVAGLRAEDEITEEVGNDVFGNIFHYCMEQIYAPYVGRVVHSDMLNTLSEDTQKIERLVDDGFRKNFFQTEQGTPVSYNGEQMLNRSVIIRYVRKQLDYDAKLCPLRIEGVENNEHQMTINLNGTPIILGGIIDRIDTVHVGTPQERHRILDYKTSSSPHTFQEMEDLFDNSQEHRPYHILQAFYYSDIYTETSQVPVAPALMYIKPASTSPDKEDESIVAMGGKNNKQPILDFAKDIKREFHERMTQVIEEIFDQSVEFTQCTNRKTCDKCDFIQICGREKTKSGT